MALAACGLARGQPGPPRQPPAEQPAQVALAGANALETRLALRPYQVRVAVAFPAAPGAALAPRRVMEELSQLIERTAGALFECRVEVDAMGLMTGPDGLERLSSTRLAQIESLSKLDKLFLLNLRVVAAGYVAQAREFDLLTGELGRVHSRRVIDAREIAAALAAAMRDAFRPVVQVEQKSDRSVVLHARAGERSAADPAWSPMTEGACFELYYRYSNKQGVVERTQRVPWTILIARDVNQATAGCEVVSGLRSPVAARRRRVALWALGLPARAPTTRLNLVTVGPVQRPIAGVVVDVADDKEAASAQGPAAGVAPRRAGLTDREGRVTVPQTAQAPQWLIVRSGQALLARVPLVVGGRDEEVLELPDDTPRLNVEGDVAMLQARLVDLVARRTVLMAQIRRHAKAAQWEAVDAVLKQLADLPKAAAFVAELEAVRVPALRRAREQKDRGLEGRIKKLCDDTAEMINAYLDPDKLRELQEEMAELKQVADQNLPGKPRAKKPVR
jgi:hypothetical protein